MQFYKFAVSVILFLGVCNINIAQEPNTIIGHITANTDNTISQPDSLLQRLRPIEEPINADSEKPSNNKTAGYRIQIFSDNNSRSAKNEARSRARAIESRFPQYRTYVTFNSPYWRLRVGDFKIQHDAVQAADEIKKAFPAYSREIRVVRDRINSSL